MNVTISSDIISTKEHISLEQLNDIIASSRFVSTVILCILLVLGVTSNSTVLAVYGLFQKKSEERFFIPFLAFFDLCAVVAGAIFAIIQNMYKVAYPSLALCKVTFFFTSMTSTVSACLLLVVAINKYLKICRPHWTQLNKRRKKLSLMIVFVFAASLSSPLFYFLDDHEDKLIYKSQPIFIRTCHISPTESQYGINLKLKLAYFGVIFSVTVINLVITVVLYILIGKEVFFRFRSIQKPNFQNHQTAVLESSEGEIETIVNANKNSSCASRNSDSDKPSENDEHSASMNDSETENGQRTEARTLESILHRIKRNARLTKSKRSTTRRKNRRRRRVRNNFTIMFTTIFILYVISYIPTVVLATIMNRIEYWISLPQGQLTLLLILRRMFIIIHVINPFIYGYFDLTFRQHFLKHVLRCLPRDQSNDI